MSNQTSSYSLSSQIASLVHKHFDALPARSKPTIYPDGSREWVPMTGIVIVKGHRIGNFDLHSSHVSLELSQPWKCDKGHYAGYLSTGAKCLSASHIPRCQGLVLHDCHAEILAMRAFNYWLLTECHGLLSEERQMAKNKDTSDPRNTKTPFSPFIRRRTEEHDDGSKASTEWPPFEFHSDIKIYMYCTCAPCGDSSMELCMASQEDATPWEVLREPISASENQELEASDADKMLDGRAHFSLLGVVRRKPARTDAESTRSKSCSDKIALRQVSSLLSCQTSRLVAPTENAYIAGLVLPQEEITKVGFDRCFGPKGRMQALVGRSWPASRKIDHSAPGYRFRPFQVLSVPSEEVAALWPFFKPKLIPAPVVSSEEETGSSTPTASPRKCKPGNASALWTVAPTHQHSSPVNLDTGKKSLPHLARSQTGLYETVINGVKQGNRASSPGKRGASALSRAKLWALLEDISPTHLHHIDRDSTSAASLLDNVEAEQVHVGTSQRVDSGLVTYQDSKRPGSSTDPLHVRIEAIRDAKRALKGWAPNSGDDNWSLGVLVDPKKRKRDMPNARA
ncbi:uncharacterized protein N7511_010041 [Penicillium nucicola]|uniref:uncharacterized protein n=1 Tax=Penicillium nucicola TaxID=1850975 RepID=UPI0025451CBE|nr:uncharacterized protein N7511_010041 [Penicillium nucicola]KAJ5748345.1 hypothetical protein N7511_010041 [Penicillium nucicola]